MTGWELVLHVLAVARLAQLLTRDRAMLWLRVRVYRWAYTDFDPADEGTWGDLVEDPWRWDALVDADADEAPAAAYLLRCWWCAGFYLAALWTALWGLWTTGWWWASLTLATSFALVVLVNVNAAVAARSDG